MLAAARDDPDGFTLMFRHAAREPEFAGYAERWTADAAQQSEKILRPIEPDPTMRRWAAEMTVHMTYQAIITWLEHGDPACDDASFARYLAVNGPVAKPAKE